MNITIPQNIFGALIALYLPDELKSGICVKNASLISKDLAEDKCDVALIPSLDLINHKEFFVSAKAGIAFDGGLSNSFLYFASDTEGDYKELALRGDISVNEILLAKILFSERFSTDVNITLDSAEINLGSKNYLISGNENLESFSNFERGISFSDLFAEVLNFPYVNFIFAAKEEKHLEKINEYFKDVDKKMEDKLAEYLGMIGLDEKINNYIKDHSGSVYFELTENEEQGLSELVKLIYYHGIIKDIIDVKFVR